jgi:hypothetical protein
LGFINWRFFLSFYISLSQGLTLPVRNSKTHYNPKTGDVMSIDPPVTVQFKASLSAPEHALKALTLLPAYGRGIGLNEDPLGRVGTFDTKEAQKEYGWDDETRAMVERILDEGSGNLYVRADYPAATAPWPNYDQVKGDAEAVAETIGRKVDEDGYDPAVVLEYERQNKNRDSVVAVLEILVEATAAVDGQVIQA